MKTINFRSIIGTVAMSMTMMMAGFANAGALSDIVGNYMVGRQINKNQNQAAVAKGVMQAYGDNDPNNVRLRGIELTPEWSQVYKMAQDATQRVDQNLANAGQSFDFCANPNVLRQLDDNPKSFDYNFNSKLPHQAANPSNLFDFSTYRELNRFNAKYTGLKPVSIPNANVIISVLHLNNGDNVSQNMSAIMLPNALVDEFKKQQTMLGRNAIIDGRDMYTATLRDIATIGYLILKNPQLNVNFDEFFITAVLTYSRNKVLCLYDAPTLY